MPARTAENSMDSALVMFAMIFASVVLPVPGGPQKMSDPVSSRSICVRSGLHGPIRCSCPAYSSSVRGRMRSASGRVRSVALSMFGAGWKSPIRASSWPLAKSQELLAKSLFPLPRGFVQYDARGYAGVERFHLRSMWNGDDFVHFGHH